MRKGIIVLVVLVIGALAISSCATHQKCPGVYSHKSPVAVKKTV